MSRIFIPAAVCLLVFLAAGCTSVTVKQEIFLDKVNVSGPVNHPPVQVTQKDQAKKVTISPKFYINQTKFLEARVKSPNVNSSGFYQVDTVYDNDGTWHYEESNRNGFAYKGANLKWDLPDMYTGLDVDLPISQSASIMSGISYSVKNGTGLLGGSLGFGFFSIGENAATRLSLGLNIQEYLYDASTIVVTRTKELFGPEETSILFYHDIDKSSKVNFYMGLTYNTISETMPFNFFVGISYFGQTLLSFNPSTPNQQYYPWGVEKYTTDTRGEASTSYLSLYPGVYTYITPSNRILFGACIMK
ncbi:MAG: hypothetical protein ACM3S2_16420, partial [Ignavibacteriales bacterium]